MKIRLINLMIFSAFLLLSGCGLVESDAVSEAQDKQVRLEFSGDFVTTSDNWQLAPYQTYYLLKFSKKNYSNVKSIIFTASLYSSKQGNTCYLELFNVTDSTVVENTLLTSDEKSYVFKETGDIYKNLPDKEINLAIRIRSAAKGTYVATGKTAYLFISRK